MLDARRQRYLDWLLTPKAHRNPMYQQGLAEELGIAATHLSQWKKEPEFAVEWERQYQALLGSPEKRTEILAALEEVATDVNHPNQIKAAAEYRAWLESSQPKRIDITHTSGRNPRDLSEGELLSLLGERLVKQIPAIATTASDA